MNTSKLILTVAALFGCLSLPASACRPFGSYESAEDQDGGIWFTEGDNNAISRRAPDGTGTAHELPTPHSDPSSVALAPDGSVWYVAMDAAKIGRLGKDGRFIEFPVTDGHPGKVQVDREGETWFTQMSGLENGKEHAQHTGQAAHNIAKVGRIDAKGEMHSYPVPEGWPTSMVIDAQGRIWVTLLVPGGKAGKPKGLLARLSRDGQWNIVTTWDNSCPNRDRKSVV